MPSDVPQELMQASHGVVRRFQVEFTRNIKEPDVTARIIAEDLMEVGVEADQVEGRWKSFSKQWTKNQQPRPHDFIQFCRYVSGGQKDCRPEIECEWCGGSALQTIARPRDGQGQWRPYLEEFTFQRPWRKTLVFPVAVPCDCAAAQSKPPPELIQLRTKARKAFSDSGTHGYMNWLHGWLRRSLQRRPNDNGDFGNVDDALEDAPF